MDESVNYKRAYEREKKARAMAEQLLDDKSRELYANVVELRTTVETLKKTQAQLVQSEKMASLGQLAAGVAHEINNPVGFSLSNITTLKEYFESIIEIDDAMTQDGKSDNELMTDYRAQREEHDMDFIRDDTPELLEDTINGLGRVKDIVANLRKLSHQGSDEFEPCNINECIEDCIKATDNELKYKMTVELELGDCPEIQGQASEINQIFINLFVNANHACEPSGTLKVKSYATASDVVVEVSDDGMGIPQDRINKIFDPFHTSKPVGVGTGLGLSISHGIMEKHSGSISVQSEVGVGTTFTLRFPKTKT
ncbi:HAMP domain-containing histidine kinase [Alteromonadaceae bacterium M269]|nr:HAMP domain-containing histidine kinase [Alteromonadaceae bacterium M269]